MKSDIIENTNLLVTKHGLSQIPTGVVGPARQLYDKKYYINTLKQKNIEINN